MRIESPWCYVPMAGIAILAVCALRLMAAEVPGHPPGEVMDFKPPGRVPPWRAMPALLMAGVVAREQGDMSLGLSIQDGMVIKGGQPYREYGVNFFNAFLRRLRDGGDTSYRKGFRQLAEHGIPYARFAACGFWPKDFELYLHRKTTYFAYLDDVVRTAEEHGVGLIPSLFWYVGAVPDMVGETGDQWGNPESKTHAFMRRYTEEIVIRYVKSPAIWAWEFGNEMNLAVDLPNAAEHRPKIVPLFGTATSRSAADDLTHEMMVVAHREFAEIVRRFDPGRAITPGTSIPRPTAYHQRTEMTWTQDSPEEYAKSLLDMTPNPCDLAQIHVYPRKEKRFGRMNVPHEEVLAISLDAVSGANKTLIVGEFGASSAEAQGGPDEVRRNFYKLLAAIEKNEVPLAAFWVYDLDHQTGTGNTTFNNDRAFMLRALSDANRRMRLGPGHNVRLRHGVWYACIHDNLSNKARQGSAFNPLHHASFPGENLFRDDAVGLNFEHIFNGTRADKDLAMFTPRRDPCALVRHSDRGVSVVHGAAESKWAIDSEIRYTLVDDESIDISFTATPREDRFPLGWCAFMWASYMNHTRDRTIHFWGDGDWLTFGEDLDDPDRPFEVGTVAYAGVENLAYEEDAQTLNVVEHPSKRFTLPFYYGLVDGDGNLDTDDDVMAYIMMFDQMEPIRFAMWNFFQTSEGKADPRSPAWDWQYVIRNPKIGKTYAYRARVVFKPFVSAEDVKKTYLDWRNTL